MTYPNEPGFEAGSETSEAAAVSMKTSAAALRRKIYDAIGNNPHGYTCDELEVLLDMSHQTCSARCTELKQQDLIYVPLDETGEKIKRVTRSGRKAQVYQAVRSSSWPSEVKS